jgi:hypothetical protein
MKAWAASMIDGLILKHATGGSDFSPLVPNSLRRGRGPRCPLYTWLSGLQGRSGRFGRDIIFPTLGIRTMITRTFIPLRSHCNN